MLWSSILDAVLKILSISEQLLPIGCGIRILQLDQGKYLTIFSDVGTNFIWGLRIAGDSAPLDLPPSPLSRPAPRQI